VTAYFDASVVLRKVLGQAGSLAAWERVSAVCCSALARLECARVLDRARISGGWSTDSLLAVGATLDVMFQTVQEIEISQAVLVRARSPLPVALPTLDAIHLATALVWREQHPHEPLLFATHDRALGRAATMMGLEVIGTD
jgi:hypothetical protein